MRKQTEREKLENLLAEIHADVHETSSEGEICLSPMVDEMLDADERWTSEGDENDELFT